MKNKTRLMLLNEAFGHFQQLTQWPENPDRLLVYTSKAEAIIEVLEVVDCGSTGGFDPHNKLSTDCEHALYCRFLTVMKKHHDEGDIDPVCGADVETLLDYFNQLCDLRERVYNKHNTSAKRKRK